MATLLIRADGNPQIGTGHVMRCLALAQGWRARGGECVFASIGLSPALEQRLVREGFATFAVAGPAGSRGDAEATVALARDRAAAWIVADGYKFDSGWHLLIKGAGLRLLVIDDYGHTDFYHGDFVLNQNLSAQPPLYSRRATSTRLLLGPEFVMLRAEFLARAGDRPARREGQRVLVTLGGSDPAKVTAKIIEAIPTSGDVDWVVVIGGSNPHRDELAAMVARRPRVQLVNDVPDLSEWMASADVAVISASSTSWEVAYLGLPAIALITADNQAAIGPALETAGVAVNLGRHELASGEAVVAAAVALLHDRPRRAAMAKRGQALVDGRGIQRILARLTAALLSLRAAVQGDSELLWRWANDPVVRAASFNTAPIGWDTHQGWYERKLADPQVRIRIGTDPDGAPLGQVRFERDAAGVAEIGISVAPQFRRAGWGAALIRRGCDEVFAEKWAAHIRAQVKADNTPSLRAFEHAGFRQTRVLQRDTTPAVELMLSADAA